MQSTTRRHAPSIPAVGETRRVYSSYCPSFLVTVLEADEHGATVRMPHGGKDSFPLTMLYPVQNDGRR